MVKFQSFTTVIPNWNDKKMTTFHFVWNLSITNYRFQIKIHFHPITLLQEIFPLLFWITETKTRRQLAISNGRVVQFVGLTKIRRKRRYDDLWRENRAADLYLRAN